MFPLNEIFNWVGSNPTVVNSEKIIGAEYLIKCGKNNENINSDVVSSSALCLTKSGKIISVKCSCRVGLGEKCKHVVEILFCCYRYTIF